MINLPTNLTSKQIITLLRVQHGCVSKTVTYRRRQTVACRHIKGANHTVIDRLIFKDLIEWQRDENNNIIAALTPAGETALKANM